MGDRYSFEERSRVIGSSDATRIMGDGDAWVELYRLKTDQAFYEKNKRSLASSILIRAGLALEAVNLGIVGDKLGQPVEPPPRDGFTADDRPFMVAMPDGIYRNLHYEDVTYHGVSPVEVKACGGWQDAEERFRYYYPQVQHEIFCMEAPGCLFGLMIGTTAHYTAYAGRDGEFLRDYIARVDRFMHDHLLPRVPPTPATVPPVRYTIPAGIVPIVVDKSEDPVWQGLVARMLDEREAKKAYEEASERVKARFAEEFQKLGNVKMVKLGQYRISLTKAGVIQLRDVSKGEDG